MCLCIICSFSFGGRGIYFGGKDVLLSELSGAFAITAETGPADKQGVFKSARVTVQFGGAHLASAQRYLQYTVYDRHSLALCTIPAQVYKLNLPVIGLLIRPPLLDSNYLCHKLLKVV